ncbi:hypothetical protein KQI84_17430 [bacterium]|nr:hypothetical protein [bacterium]
MPTPQHAKEIARDIDSKRMHDSLGMEVAFWTGAVVSAIAFLALVFTWIMRN